MRNLNNKTVDQVGTSYSYYIKEKLNKIYAMSRMKSVSLESMKKNIRNYVWNANYSYQIDGITFYTKKQEFLDKVYSMESKKAIYKYCSRVVNKAEDTIAR